MKLIRYLFVAMQVFLLWMAFVSAGWTATAATESALMVKADKLRAKPFADAAVVATLAVKQPVSIISRNGAWYQVNVAGKKGWVNMLSVRKTANAAVASAGSLSTVAAGRSGTGNIIATTGIRGLNEEQLAQATFSEESVTAAEKFRTSAADAAKFASAGGLKVRAVPTLPDKN